MATEVLEFVKNEENWKVIAYVSSVALTVGGVTYFVWKYKAEMHDNIPVIAIDAYQPILGHVLPIIDAIKNRRLHKQIYENIRDASFPSVSCLCRPPKFKIVLIQSPDLLKYIFETKFESAIKGPTLQERYYELLGDGIFLSDGKRWKFHRKVASRMFSMRNLKNYMFSMSVKHTQSTILKLHELMNSKNLKYIDLNDILGRFSLDTFCEIAFGKNIGSVATYPKTHEFGIAFDDLVERLGRRATDLFWKIKRMTNIGNEKYIHNDHKIITTFVEKMMDKQTQQKNNNNVQNIMDESGSNEYDLLSLYLKFNADLSVEELKNIAMNFIIAGRDTTRLLLSWFLYEMCNAENSGIKKLVYAEIDDFCKQNGDDQQPSYSDFKNKFMYLEGCLCETLRLWPSVPVLARYAAEDIDLPKMEGDDRAYTVRKDNMIFVHTFTMGRNPKIWGDDALKFDPLRWKDKGINQFDQYKFPAFNVNPRLCLGKQFAITEAKVFAYYFLKEFDLELKHDHQVVIKPGAVLNMQNGLPVKLYERDDSGGTSLGVDNV